MLGKDSERNEYWFFKEEPGKLFIKKFEYLEPVPQPVVENNNGEN